jgi:serine/threonine protein kinase/tetratricopeptide (TPR) repeat protein
LSPEAGVLGRLAASVADGTPVDWSHVEPDIAPGERRLVPHLRLVESIASLYRSIPDLGETAPDVVPSGPRWGRLVMLERIGQGMSCEVHRAFDTDLHRQVALKLLHEEGQAARVAHDRILQEARRLARVRHPHVVQVLGAEQHNDRVGLWMELVEGESLDRTVRSRGTFGAREASVIGQDVCSALAAVHASGLLHRDVKAQNVMREEGGRIVLMDFGTGEELFRDRGTPRIVGTPLYLAPEILDGKAASVQSDLYSVGVLLFYLVTGEFPVTASNIEQLGAAHKQRQLRRLRDVRPDLPSGFVKVIDRALEHEPAARFQSAGEMEAALRDQPGAFQPPGLVGEVKPKVSTWRPAAWVSVAAMLAVVVGLIAWVKFSSLAGPTPTAPMRIAVLPFKDLSATPTSFLADGLTNQLIATLGQVRSLRVTAPGATSKYKQSTISTADVERDLGVDAIVEGTITSVPTSSGQPPRAKVTTSIRRAGSSAALWSDSFDWVAGSTDALQLKMTRSITSALNARTDADRVGSATAAQRNPAAEQAYLQGMSALSEYGLESRRRALEAFKRATLADDSYAAAFAALSDTYVRLGQLGGMALPEARQSALIAARRAMELDPSVANAHQASADLSFYFDWDWATAEVEYSKALDLNPSLSRARMNYAELLAARRRFEDAFAQADVARSLDPSGEVNRAYGVLLLYARRFDEAEALMLQTLNTQSNLAGAYLLRGRVAESQGRYEDAFKLLTTAAQYSNGGGVPLQVAIAAVQARAGHVAEARQAFDTLEQQAARHEIYLSDRDRAYMLLALGDEAGACDAFERALENRDQSLIWLGVDPRLDSLRGSPRFETILKRIGVV